MAISTAFPLWIAWQLSRTFVADLGPEGVATLRTMIVALLAYTATILAAVTAALRLPRFGWWLLALLVLATGLGWLFLLWVAMDVGATLRLGSAAMVALQLAGTHMLNRRGNPAR